MIGNDVIDLALAHKESNWQRKGFLEKIFTPKEQQLILNAENPEIMVWNLWSRKEASYKIFNRETGIRIYNPKQFECDFQNYTSGSVCFNGIRYYTSTKIAGEKINTIAVSEKNYFKRIISISREFEIIKIEGAPYRKAYDSQKLVPVSISHHGRFRECIELK